MDRRSVRFGSKSGDTFRGQKTVQNRATVFGERRTGFGYAGIARRTVLMDRIAIKVDKVCSLHERGFPLCSLSCEDLSGWNTVLYLCDAFMSLLLRSAKCRFPARRNIQALSPVEPYPRTRNSHMTLQTKRHDGRRVLITAGGSGIGHAMACAFAAQGAQVWVTDLDISRARPDWRADRVDVRDPVAMEALFSDILEHWGGLDVLCANAGIAGPTALLEDQPIDGFRDCIAVNVEGAFLAARGAVPMMKRQGGGAILFTSSTAGLYGFPYRAPYAAAKWALHGLMKTVAMEGGPFGVRANVIAPGSVEGPRIDGVFSREAAAKGTTPEVIRSAYAAGTSLRTLVSAQDIAEMAVFLASDEARRVSGQIIAVDGHTENPDPKVP